MKMLVKYIGYIMSIAGFAVLVWRSSASFEKLSNKFDRIDAKVEALSSDIKHMTENENTITGNMVLLVGKQDEIGFKQDALQRSYVEHLKKDRRYEELIQYLQLFNFNVKDAVADTIKFNILINKSNGYKKTE